MRKRVSFEKDIFSLVEIQRKSENHLPKSKEEQPKIVKTFYYRGKQCVIINNIRFHCAYAETKIKNPTYSSEPAKISADNFIHAHGGVTFAGDLEKFPELDGKYFFGIDFGHSGDHVEFPEFGCSQCKSKQPCRKWTLTEIEQECKKLADGVIRYEKMLPHFIKAKEQFEKDVQWTIDNYGK